MRSFFYKRTTKIFAIIFLIAGFLFFQKEAFALTTGQVYPSLGTTAAESPWLDNNWTTPTNIYSDNDATANVTSNTYDSPDQTYVLKATGFNFSAIPDGSTINGVTARINAFYRPGQGSGSMDLCQLLNVSQAKVGTNQCSTAVPLTTNNATIITKGSTTDTWGNALTTAWIKDPDFGIAIGVLATGANAEVDVDYVTLEISYTLPTYTITATSGANGAVLPSGATIVTQGNSQAYTINPNPEYTIATLTIDGGSIATSTSYTFSNVQTNHTISATFAIIPVPPVTYTIVATSGANGAVTPTGTTTVAQYGSQIYAITPNPNYGIATISIDGSTLGATSTSYTFSNVTANHTISATFVYIPPPPGSFTIIANQNPNGAIAPTGSTVVPSGGSQMYTITPDSGYDVGTLIIDSQLVSASTTYTFTNVGANHTIEATFVALPVAETPAVGGRRLASITFSGKAFPGGKISIVHKELDTEVVSGQQDVTNIAGFFNVRFIDLPVGAHSFGLLIKDPEGRTSQTKFFLVDANRGDEIFKDIVAPPTVDVLSGQVSRGGNVKVFGYASPGHTIRIYLNDILSKEVLAGRGGAYSFELPTGALPFGQHKIRTKQINLDGGTASDFSTERTFVVSKLTVVKADFSGDGKIDIKDWSIFLARFASRDNEIKSSIDLTGDGKVDISDFSIFIKTLRKK